MSGYGCGYQIRIRRFLIGRTVLQFFSARSSTEGFRPSPNEVNLHRPEIEITLRDKEAPANLWDIPVSDEDLEINTDPASVEEVRKAVSSMKSGKAPGADGVSADMLKAGREIIVRTLTEIFEGI